MVVIDIPLTPDLAPTAHMTAYYVRPDLEIVADSIAFNVDGVFKNKVSLELSANRTEPHTDLEVYVTADPDSTVYLLAVDQSALLLKTGNDITPRQVEDAVAVYDVGTSKPSESAFALSLSRQDIANTMQEVGITVSSDANLYATLADNITTPYDPSINGPVPLALRPPITPVISTTQTPNYLDAPVLPKGKICTVKDCSYRRSFKK
ncbi:alpha-1-inhibitor 3-like [Pomacea canaliculata]|uniref:alpha-1-inhibitor 3-like n=1 Tax=Pomacea canaliculata TaxID=400727 RepID=UPI000D72DC46|nr:alpha-1-inhibitor 3-like [Pomacea canaliculata]